MRILVLLLLSALAFAQSTAPQPPAKVKKPKWKLAWRDEFKGHGVPDITKWVLEEGAHGWGNNEWQCYTKRPENARIQNGKLVIHVRKEAFTCADGKPSEYTSARMKTSGKFAQKYGKFEARIKIPGTQGIWPAFWMLGEDIKTVGWPKSGEIDIMENIGKEPGTVHGTIHGPGYSGGSGISGPYKHPKGGRFADKFHVYGVEWEPEVIRFYVDGNLYHTLRPANLPAGSQWVFDHPYFLLLNVAVGGNWPGYPDASTVFPQYMLVDWVRVYRDKSRKEDSAAKP